MGKPSIYPTGTTIFKPDKCWNGYTLFEAPGRGAMLIDMNGRVVRHWKDLQGFPVKILPGGSVIGTRGERDVRQSYQDRIDLVQCDWDGNIEWVLNRNELINDPGIEEQWMLRQHHDFQREGNPVGYYVPGMEMKKTGGKTLVLTHTELYQKKISAQRLLDDCLIEFDENGNKLWEWKASDHFAEFDFSETAKNALYRDPNTQPSGPEGQGDWMHINTASYLGPNRYFDAGDNRFDPENIIMDSREASILFIISHKTGKVVWQIGPDYTKTSELRIMGPIIGPHNAHMIPRGLPGEGNILVFDNGGWSGYGAPGQTSKTGLKSMIRDYSRVLEIDPVTLKVVWQFDTAKLGLGLPFHFHYFYSPLVSNAQRLENGNTLICEGTCGRFLEVTPQGEIVWEYVSPYIDPLRKNSVVTYRCYRCPYEWIPQLEKPAEVPIEPVDITKFRLPGADPGEYDGVTVSVEGAWGYARGGAYCVQ